MKTIIIEDEEALLESYSEIVQGVEAEIMKAPDGYKGLKALEDNKGKIDLVVLDLMMPGMDSLEVLRTIKGQPEKYGKMPVIVLTNMVSEKVIKECYDLGAKSYLIKTELSAQDLINEVKRVLQ
jgi:two-component system alkaline phosphatase synthesis response regulator PhoP